LPEFEIREMSKSIKMEDGTIWKYKPIVTIKCMFCGLEVNLVKFISGTEGAGVIHVEPRCATFMAMDPEVFFNENLRLMRKDVDEGKTKPN
jgi:hypothetical protein